MTDIDEMAQHQQRLLQMLKQNAAFAGEQASLLSGLSFRHAQAITHRQTETTRAAAAAWLELIPKFAVPRVADAFSEYMKDCGQRWILFLDTLCQRSDACKGPAQTHDVNKFPQVKDAIKKAKIGG